MSHHDPKEGNDSIGTRIKTGFLSFRKKEGGGGGAPAAAGGTSDAEVQEMRAAMQKLKEQVQQLELEKALMRNLVDSVCGSGEDNSNEPKGAEGEDAEREKAKATMAEMCTKIAALTVSNGEHEERARKAEQKCAALEAALVHSRDELKEADSTGQKLRAQAGDVAAMQAKIAALTAELQSSQTTIQQLMDRVSKTSNDKEQSARDYSLVLEKMTTQSDTLVKDLNERTEQLSKLNREIAFLRAENEKLRQESQDRERHQSAQQVVDRSLLKEAEERHTTIVQELKMHYEEELKSLQQATALALETEKSALEEQLARSKANHKVVVKELQEAHQKTLDEKETAWTAERDRIRNEFEEQHNDAVTKIMSDFETKEASLNDQIEALKVEIQRCKEEKDALDATIRGKEQRITELETEVNSLNDVADASEITIAEKDVMLNKLLRQVEALEEEKLQIASTQKGQVESLQREVEAVKAEKVALEAKLSGFDDHLAEVENEYKIKLKKNATVVKDLQQALAKLQEEGVRAATGAAAAAAAKPEPEQPHGAAEPVKEAHDGRADCHSAARELPPDRTACKGPRRAVAGAVGEAVLRRRERKTAH